MTGRGKPKRSETAEDRLADLADAARRLDEARAPEEVAAAAKALLTVLENPAELAREAERRGQQADAQIRQTLLSLEANLRSVCAARGWSLDGVWPTFFVEKAVEIVIDEGTRLVRVAGQRTRLDAECVADAAAPLVRQLLPRTFSTTGFLQSIADAVDASTKAGGSAPVSQVYRQLVIDAQSSRFWRDAKAELFVPLSLEQFRARLSATLDAGTRLSDGRALRLSPPLKAEDGIFIWQPAERRFGYVGRLQLVHEAQP